MFGGVESLESEWQFAEGHLPIGFRLHRRMSFTVMFTGVTPVCQNLPKLCLIQACFQRS